MDIRYLYKNVKIDERTKEYVEKRISKLEEVMTNISQFEVEIDLDKKGKFRVELMMKTPSKLFRAEDISESVEASADLACAELLRQVKKSKTKLRDMRERRARSIKKKVVLSDDARFKK